MSLVHVDAMRKIAMTMTTYEYSNIHIKGQEGVTLFFEPNQDLEKETEGERREAKGSQFVQ